jgi:hypothetical protein
MMRVQKIPLTGLRIGLALAIACATSYSSLRPARAQQAPINESPLTLTLADLPPGYREVIASTVDIGEGPADTRVFMRAGAGAGPVMIFSVTIVGDASARTEVMARARREWAELGDGVRRNQSGQLSDCEALDATGVGEDALLYRCQFQWTEASRPEGEPATEEMANLSFRRGNITSTLAITSADGLAVEAARQYGGLLDARIMAYLGSQQP